jgi:inhibitor of KinA sporulation pathway (predicted exonuclease)
MSTPKLCLVIDVEATCWRKNPPSGTPIMERQNEIIEIGITPISMPDKEILTSESIIVLPTTTEISEFCTELTSLTPEFVNENGITFRDAIEYMREKYRTDRNMWASWGKYDDQIFYRQCEREHVNYPFNNNHLNVKSLYCWKYGSPSGLGRACRRLNIEFEGTAHRGIDDSRNIARILLEL